MTDSDEKKKGGIPSWQKQDNTTEKEEEQPKEISRIDQAKRFLEADEVRTSSLEKQGSFLKTKGYSEDEIRELLGRDTPQAEETPSPADAVQTSTPPPQSEDPHHPPPQQTTHISQESQPPIITYPEFLTKPTAPSPLITSSRLLTTLTLFSSLSMILYGTNKYLLTPMQESLNQSRHELLTQASDHLTTLNEKLGEIVSEQPTQQSKDEVEVDDEESDGDPTEMFHRDVGIQTSPSLLNSRPSTPSPESNTLLKPLESQLSRLSIISTHLKEVNTTSASEGADAAELSTTIDVLKEYLENMAFTASTYSFGAQSYGGMVRDAVGGEGRKDELDEIAKLKAGIRSVKGVLLSARSFPMSSGRGVGMNGVR